MPTLGLFDHGGMSCSVNLAYSKSYYLKQVHQPRHLKESARLFGPTVLEVSLPDAPISHQPHRANSCVHARLGMWYP